MIIDDEETISADSQKAKIGDMKKITIALIPQMYNEHAHFFAAVCNIIMNPPP